MGNLIINRIKFIMEKNSIQLFIAPNENLFYRIEAKYFIDQMNDSLGESLRSDLINKLPADFAETKVKISYDFNPSQHSEWTSEIKLNVYPFLKKAFIKNQLMSYFKNHSFVIYPFSKGCDFSVYEKTRDYNSDWNVYNRYDITIFHFENEISISLGGTDTLISKMPLQIDQIDENVKIIDPYDGYLKQKKFVNGVNKSYLMANSYKKKVLGIKNKIKKTFYREGFDLINRLYLLLLNDFVGLVRFESGGFKTVHPSDIDVVEFDKNTMVFGKDHTDVNAASGMRDGGPYQVPKDKAERLKLLFIYENKDQANNLYINLKRGLKHFPGLLSYVGIPVNILNERLQYTSEASILEELNSFLLQALPNEFYPDYLGLVLLPFSKETAEKNDSDIYFAIKEKLLKKGIVTQDIDARKINSGSFHYHLPNISIAILAKIGGIPWKLKSKPYSELIVGFNEEHLGDNLLLGSAVYFDNSGKLVQVKAFNGKNRKELIQSLRQSIQVYLDKNENPPKRLVIHYYKKPKEQEIKWIDELIRDEFRFNLPFALVEINDSKVKTDICFDVGFNYGMPTSGTFVRLKRKGNEYLLFNNLRYWENPIKPIESEEYPVKVKLYNTESGGFTHKELLSQVYEFSRLYWKGLKQKSQPVTTQYAKMIANFAIHFNNGNIPINESTQSTAWFI